MTFATHTTLSAAQYAAARAGHLQRRRHGFVFEAFGRAFARGARAALELGSGAGALLAELGACFPAVRFYGVEPSAPLREHAQACIALQNVHCLSALPLPECVDFIASVDVLHHLPAPAETFAELRLAANEGARWIVIEPNVWHPYVTLSIERMKRAGLEEDHFRPWRMLPELQRAGWDLERRSYAIAVPASVQQLPRWLERAELQLERCPLLAGSVVLQLRAR